MQSECSKTCFYSPCYRGLLAKKKISKISNSVRRDLLEKAAFCREETSGIIFISVLIVLVGGSGNKSVLRSVGGNINF